MREEKRLLGPQNHRRPRPVFWVLFATLLFLITSQTGFAYTLSNSTFNVQTGSSGEISSLQIAGDNFPTNYVMNATNASNQNTADHQWVGELMFKYRLGSGSWLTALTNASGDVRTQSQSGSTVTVTYQNSGNSNGVKNFKLVETYSLVSDYLQWSIAVTNTSAQTLEIGDFGLPLPFNMKFSNESLSGVYENRVLYHDNVANNNSYIEVTRPSGIGSYLLMVPDTTTGAGFEYKDRWVSGEHPGSSWVASGDWPDGLQVYYIHSNVIKSTNRGYLANSSLTLAPNATKTYTFKFFKVADQNATKDRLYSEGLIDTTIVPGMIVPTNQTVKIDLHTSKAIGSIAAPSGASMAYQNTVATDHKIYSITMSQLGQNNFTVNYGTGEKTVLQFYAIEPVDAAIQRHATFMVQKTQWNAPGQFYDKVFDDWMMDSQAKRNNFSGYMGWGDDWGLTHGQFLAEKNVQRPVASEITAVDQYLETAVWNQIMNKSTYQVHDWLNKPVYTDDFGRSFAYPHVANTWFAMYKIAKLYPNIVTFINAKNTYLLRAYNVMSVGLQLSYGTGNMGEQSIPEIISALKTEGYTTEANSLTSICTTKYNNFSSQAYPYGSEYNYDNTGEESAYMLAKMKNNASMMSKINAKTRASRGTQPLWYFYADPITITGSGWWNFQYSAALIGYAMDDWTRYRSTTPELDQRLTYAAKLANISAINSGQIDANANNIGTVAWSYQASKGNYYEGSAEGGNLHNGWRQMAGEADLGLWGAIRIISADVAVDPLFGLLGYGCDVSQVGSSYVITPKDGVFQKLNLITQKFYMSLERDQYSAATVPIAKDGLSLTLTNMTPGTSHNTQVTISGLSPRSYDVMVNGSKVGSVTAVSGQDTVVNVGVGTAASYMVALVGGTPPPEVLAYYKFNETSGTTASDSSGSGNAASVTSGTWVSGKDGNALGLNGTSGFASVPTGIVSSLGNFTIASWVKITTNSDWARIFDFGTGTNTYMFLAPRAGGAGLRYAISTSGNGGEQQLNAPALATGTWVHVAVTLNGTTGTLYVNGAQVAQNTAMTLSPASLGSTNQNYLGKSQWADPLLNGALDEFKIYSRALSASEVATLAGTVPTATNIAPQGTASTSFVSSWESLAGLNDSYTPTSSNDRGHPVYGNWDNPGTTQWVQYDFSQSYTISSIGVYWFDDDQGIDLPASCSVQYWTGTAWANVASPVGLGTLANQYNTTSFTPVATTKVRLNVTAKAASSSGIESWRVYGY